MHSPVKNRKQMNRIQLEEGLIAYQCPETSGVFLPVSSYVQWLSRQPARLPQLPPSESSEQECLTDSQEAKICPESGQLMQRYAIGHDFSFYVDRSPSGSLWFDKGEWEALRKRQYHDELHLIFTAPWQDKVRAKRKANAERAILLEKLGGDLLGRIDSLIGELEGHDYQSMAIAYLQNSTSKG